MLNALGNSLISLVFPQECHICSQLVDQPADGIACSACWSGTRAFDSSSVLCVKCGAYSGQHSEPPRSRCGKCTEHFYDGATAAGVYEKAIAATVLHLKTVPYLPPAARTVLLAAFERAGFRPTVIIPVPLSRRRALERGFNQAEIIGKTVAKFAGVPMYANGLVRTVHSAAHRIGMDMKARELTVKKSFAVTRPKLIAGKDILMVDDVFTSGSTTSNCAKVLKDNGAVRVNVLTLARAISD
jgi:ComF family protein